VHPSASGRDSDTTLAINNAVRKRSNIMAVLTQKNAQQFNVGQVVEFIGYDGDATGELQVGDKLKITGFDPDNQLYNVEREDGHEDSLFDVEFTPFEEKTEEKPAAKRGRPKKEVVKDEVAEDESEEEETPAPAPKAKGRPKKQVVESVDDDEEQEEQVKESPKAKRSPTKAVEVEEEEEEEDEKPITKAKSSKNKQSDEEEQAEEDVQKEIKKALSTAKPKQQESEDSSDLQEFVQTESVSEVLSLHKDPLKAAMALAEEKERTIFTLGGVLAKIKRYNTFRLIEDKQGEPVYESGNKGFNAYVKDELGMEPRSAAYYVDLYEMFSQVTTEEKISKIGWTKLRELLPLREVITEDNVDKWLKKAKTTTTKELHDVVTKFMVDAGEEAHGNKQLVEQTTYKYVVHSDQANTVEEAIAKAKEIIGDDASDGAALVHILSEWLQLSDEE
jgi:hypothetical protein